MYVGDFSGKISTGIPSEVLYPSIAVTVLLVIVGAFWNRIRSKKRFILWVLLFEYVFVVLCSTIICRGVVSASFDRLELMPFWTYDALLKHTPGIGIHDIILNTILFMPLGFLVKLLWQPISFARMLLAAILCSIFIETNQYFFEKGIAQFDDVMHNVIGAMIGWFLACGILAFKNRKVTR